jgi:dephospho-CoA kinase
MSLSSKIALTGGAAEGKSTVLAMLADQGVRTCDADSLAKAVSESPEMQAQLAVEFELSLPIDRGLLLEKITKDAGARRRLNRLMHAEVLRQIEMSDSQVVEIPLVFEACLFQNFSEIWVVTCGEQEQQERLAKRLGSMDAAAAMMKTQLPTSSKIAFADEIIRTNLDLASVQTLTRTLVLSRNLV